MPWRRDHFRSRAKASFEDAGFNKKHRQSRKSADVLADQNMTSAKDNFRTNLNVAAEVTTYGAAYYPYLKTSISYEYDKNSLIMTGSQTGVPDQNLNRM